MIKWVNYWIFCLSLILIAHLFLLLNLRFTVWPEMILYPWLLNSNFVLYKDIINPYFPLFSVFLSFIFNIIGLSVVNLKIISYLIILSSNLIVFFVALKLSKNFIRALISSLVYLLLQISFGGNTLWFEIILVPIILSTLALVYFYPKSMKIVLLSGVFLGLSVLIKQNSILFLIPILIYLIQKKEFKNIIHMLSALIIIGIFLFIYLFSKNTFFDFITWTFILPLTFSSQNGFVILPTFKQLITILFPFITLVGVIKVRGKIYWSLSFIIALSFVLPRFEDFHMQVLVALSSIFVSLLPPRILVIFLIISSTLFIKYSFRNWHQNDRFIDQETYNLAAKIKNYQSVYLINSPELAYFFANKLPPKPWATNFPWYFSNLEFEENYVNKLKSQKIEYIVIKERLGGGEYALGNYIPDGILNFVLENYILVEKFENFEIWQRKLDYP